MSFEKLGDSLGDESLLEEVFSEATAIQYQENYWFTPEFCRTAIGNVQHILSRESLENIYNRYKSLENEEPGHPRIAVVTAGKSPLDDFADFFSVLVAGCTYIGILPQNSRRMLPAMAQLLGKLDPELASNALFVERPRDFDAIIYNDAGGNVSTSNPYFGKYPNIIRRYIRSVAVIDGKETDEELNHLADAVYTFFGRARSSVCKIFVPEGYDFVPVFDILSQRSAGIARHNQFLNNIEYQKAAYLMNKIHYLDAGTFLFVENKDTNPPPGIVYYETYGSQDVLMKRMREIENDCYEIYCSSRNRHISGKQFKCSLHPEIDDIPEIRDALNIAMELSRKKR